MKLFFIKLLADIVGTIIYCIVPIRRDLIRHNIRQAFPDYSTWQSRQLILSLYQQLVHQLLDIVAWRNGLPKKYYKIEGLEYYKAAKSKGKGVIIVGPHLGSWQMLMPTVLPTISEKPHEFNLMRRTSSTKNRINHFLHHQFEKASIGVLYKKNSAFRIKSLLKNNSTVIFPIDQRNNPEKGAKISLFNRQCYVGKAPAFYQHKLRSPVIPLCQYRNSKGIHVLKFLPEVHSVHSETFESSMQNTTQAYIDEIETIIFQYPEQWFCWTHNFWKHQRA